MTLGKLTTQAIKVWGNSMILDLTTGYTLRWSLPEEAWTILIKKEIMLLRIGFYKNSLKSNKVWYPLLNSNKLWVDLSPPILETMLGIRCKIEGGQHFWVIKHIMSSHGNRATPTQWISNISRMRVETLQKIKVELIKTGCLMITWSLAYNSSNS